MTVNSKAKWAGLAAAYLACRLMTFRLFAFYDDAYITFRFAENLAAGKGFVYNLGEPVLGITTPLFGFLLGCVKAATGLPVFFTAAAVAIVAELGVIGLLWKSGRNIPGNPLWWISGFLMLIDPYLSRIAAGGMESYLFVFLIWTGLYLLSEENTKSALTILAASYWVRPEAVLALAAAFVFMAARWNNRRYLPAIGLAAAVWSVPAIIIWSYFGTITPQSVLAKSTSVRNPVEMAALLFHGWDKDPLQGILTVSAVAALPLVFKSTRFLRLALYFTAFYAAAYLVARPQMWSWYAAPVFVFKIVASSVLFIWILGRVKLNTFLPSPGGAAGLALMIWLFFALYKGHSPVRETVYRPMQEYLNRHVTAQDSVYAHDIGVIGYFSGAYILDHFGLIWPDYRKYGDWKNIIKELHPKYVLLVTGLQYGEFMRDGELASRYNYSARFAEGQPNAPQPPIDKPKTGWSNDYVLLTRVASQAAIE